MLSRVLLIVLLGVGVAGSAMERGQAPRSASNGWIDLPMELPAVGNIDDVGQWRIGRVEEIEFSAGTDIRVRIRMRSGGTVRVVMPGSAFEDMAYASDWRDNQFNDSFAGRRTPVGSKDYVERLVAFDVDRDGRVIAMVSMEPMDRNNNRLRRVLRN